MPRLLAVAAVLPLHCVQSSTSVLQCLGQRTLLLWFAVGGLQIVGRRGRHRIPWRSVARFQAGVLSAGVPRTAAIG